MASGPNSAEVRSPASVRAAVVSSPLTTPRSSSSGAVPSSQSWRRRHSARPARFSASTAASQVPVST